MIRRYLLNGQVGSTLKMGSETIKAGDEFEAYDSVIETLPPGTVTLIEEAQTTPDPVAETVEEEAIEEKASAKTWGSK